MNNLGKNLLYVFIAVIIGKLIGSFTSTYVARFLAPPEYGLYVTFLLVISYSPIICLGTVESLLKEYPYYIGKGNIDKAKEIENGVFTSVLAASVIVIFIIYIATNTIKTHFFLYFSKYIQIMSYAACTNLLYAFFYHRLIAHQKFKYVSIVDTTRSISTLIILLFFSYKWGLEGIVYGVFINESFMFVFAFMINVYECELIAFNFNIKNISELIRIGFPISIMWWIFIIQTSLDRVLSMSFLGERMTGYLGLGVSLVSAIMIIPQVIGTVLYPRINEKVGAGEISETIQNYIILPTRAYSVIIPFIIGIVAIGIPFLITNVFPKYIGGIFATQALLMDVFFLCFIRNGVNFLISINKQRILIILFCISLFIKVSISLIFIKFGLGIFGLSIGTTLSSMILSIFIWWSVFVNIGYKNIEIYNVISNLYYPMFVSTIILVSIILLGFKFGIANIESVIVFIMIYVGTYVLLIYSNVKIKGQVKELIDMIMITIKGKVLPVSN